MVMVSCGLAMKWVNGKQVINHVYTSSRDTIAPCYAKVAQKNSTEKPYVCFPAPLLAHISFQTHQNDFQKKNAVALVLWSR